ncbi:hypothetical protein N8590_01320 [bacterium]|jgi:hypothetical protein|nr:hypothetical protein [Planctomicrobium sp.]MDA7527606.1 hypothetical protein [bacterium]
MSTPHFDRIDDPVAEDFWNCKKGGNSFIATIRVGRPILVGGDPNGDWCCPVLVQPFSPSVVAAMGVGPVDALLNATSLIQKFAEDLDEYSPRALDLT